MNGHSSSSSTQLRDHRTHITAPLGRYTPSQTQAASPSATSTPNSSTHDHLIGSRSTPGDRMRAPNPAKKATPDRAFDETKRAAAIDAVRERTAETQAAAAKAHAVTARNASEPVLGSAAVLRSSPPTSPSMSVFPKNHRQEIRPNMNRAASIDSTVSSLSSASTSQRPNGTNAYRISESSGPQDAASLIASAGSPEAAVLKLLNEKNSAASHNAQLWRLVEKQRAMILGLNKDLEKSLKEKDRYRRKLKENIVQSSSSMNLTSAGQQVDELVGRESSQSPALAEQARMATPQSAVRELGLASRKVSDASDATSLAPGRSDMPQDASNAPSSVLPSTPQSATSMNVASRELDRSTSSTAVGPVVYAESKPTKAATPLTRILTGTPPVSPSIHDTARSPKSPHQGHKQSLSISSAASPPPSAASFSGAFKGASRKAPPAPLNLSPKPVIVPSTQIVDASESEYEEDPDSARVEQMARGRRKTREEDDRERDAVAQQEEEHRSRSKKAKSSQSKRKSKSQPPAEKPAIALDYAQPPAPKDIGTTETLAQRPKPATYQPIGDPSAILRHRAVSDAAGLLQRNITAPALLSPGLPMSPRPGDRPMNSPMPRAPNKNLSSMPMSPRSGVAGLPLSPRPPKMPIPMPPQTPLAFASPHLARAEAYQHQPQASQSSMSTLGSYLKPSPNPSPEHEYPPYHNVDPKTPGEVYRGLVTEQYPDLLLPPNALPSIFVKTASPRMRPSRQSYMMPKISDENPVFIMSIHERSDRKQLWRVEKTYAALATLDQHVRQVTIFRDRIPDKSLFTGHAPSKIDARRLALDGYFDRMLDAVQDERAAKVVCRFLSADAMAAESNDYFPTVSTELRPDTPVSKGRTRLEGYLTKRGKNFGGWKARYFVLDGPNLKYFEAPGGAHLGSIKLQNAQIGKQSPGANHSPGEDEDNQFRHAFLILEPKRKDSTNHVRHVLCAESDEERDRWVDALLQYVDYRDDGEEIGRGVPILKADISGPRLQRSINDLRPASRGLDASQSKHFDPLRSVGYDQTIAGEAPVIGLPVGRRTDGDSPSYDGSFSGASSGASEPSAMPHPSISAPSNAHVIQNAGDWGMRPPPTPGHQKEKKRGLFNFRGRSSSDLGPEKIMSSGMAPDSTRAVFGIPLAEAVEAAHPVGVTTELPAVFYRCIEYLTDKGAIAEEGIFRLSGSNTVIKALRERFNTEGDVNLVADGKYYDIHAVASLLKLFLRELPASVLTRELHLEFLSCLEMNARDKIVALNVLVNRLPRSNRALLETLSEFLLAIVSNADVNKMNVRNVGIVFAPTLNVPGPLISSFVEDQARIFGPPIDGAESPIATQNVSAPQSTDLRSPRKQMFSDLPTPAYNQTTFQSFGQSHGHQTQDTYGSDDTGMIPVRPSYSSYQMAPQGEGGYGSLNDALRSPTVFGASSSGMPTAWDAKSKRRESSMMLMGMNGGQVPKKPSMSRLREGEGASF